MQDGRCHGRLHAGLPREVDVQLGRRQVEVERQLRRQHGLLKKMAA